jgi:hypothetical protein
MTSTISTMSKAKVNTVDTSTILSDAAILQQILDLRFHIICSTSACALAVDADQYSAKAGDVDMLQCLRQKGYTFNWGTLLCCTKGASACTKVYL